MINEEIVAMFDEGMSPAQIANEIGKTLSDVRIVLYNAQRIEATRNTSVISAKIEEKLLKRYYAFEPVDNILTSLDLKINDLWRVLAKNGLSAREKTPEHIAARKLRYDHVMHLYANDHKLVDITSETGISQPQLHIELHKRRWPLRRDWSSQGDKVYTTCAHCKGDDKSCVLIEDKAMCYMCYKDSK